MTRVFLILSLGCAPVIAQTSHFTVEILGAESLRPFLETHLPIIRASRDSTISDDERQSLIQRSPQHLQDLLATEGYFSAQVRSEEIINATRHLIRFTVDLGEPVRVTDVRLDFSGEILTMEVTGSSSLTALRQQWSLRPGERFTQAGWEDAKTALLNNVLQTDFPAARLVESHAEINPLSRTAKLSVLIDSGPAFTLGELDIQGLSRYPTELIHRLNLLRPGERYHQARLSALQSRLLDTGYFSTVFVTVDADPERANGIPVRVELKENPAKRLGLGVGISTDVGARLQVKWLNRHFLGESWRLESLVRMDRLSQLAQSELYFQPLQHGLLHARFEGWIPSIALAIERTTLTGVETEKIRNSARLSTPSRINERVMSLSLLADRRTIPGIETRTRQALIAGYAWTRRHFDQALAPTRGYSAGIDLSTGFGGAFHEDRIARVLVSGVWLHPLDSRWTAVARLQAGQLSGAREDSVPEDLLFRTGGDQSVRGYGYGRLGVQRNRAIVGGNVMAVISTELILSVAPAWGIAIFHDAGNAALSWQDFQWRRSLGLGARWRSPIGAIHLDLARALDQGDTRLHFSVGYGF